MHDTPRPSEDTTINQVAIDSLIADLATGDPADGPDIAEEIAVRLEADLGTAPGTAPSAEAAPDFH